MSERKRKYFGTDGIRGTVGEHPITPDFVMKLGWAAGRVLSAHAPGRQKVLIGKDTRVSGYMFESALEAGLSAAGILEPAMLITMAEQPIVFALANPTLRQEERESLANIAVVVMDESTSQTISEAVPCLIASARFSISASALG